MRTVAREHRLSREPPRLAPLHCCLQRLGLNGATSGFVFKQSQNPRFMYEISRFLKDNEFKFLRNTEEASAKKVLINHDCRLCLTHKATSLRRWCGWWRYPDQDSSTYCLSFITGTLAVW